MVIFCQRLLLHSVDMRHIFKWCREFCAIIIFRAISRIRVYYFICWIAIISGDSDSDCISKRAKTDEPPGYTGDHQDKMEEVWAVAVSYKPTDLRSLPSLMDLCGLYLPAMETGTDEKWR